MQDYPDYYRQLKTQDGKSMALSSLEGTFHAVKKRLNFMQETLLLYTGPYPIRLPCRQEARRAVLLSEGANPLAVAPVPRKVLATVCVS